jgi:hypothetical protein
MNTNIQQEVKRITEIVLKSVITVLNKANVETSKKEASKFPIKIDKDSIDVFLPSYYEWVDSGRKAGKRPPIKPIIDWIKREKIDTKDIGIVSLAYAISNSIGIEGTKARPFIEDLQQQIAILVRDYLVNKINKTFTK